MIRFGHQSPLDVLAQLAPEGWTYAWVRTELDGKSDDRISDKIKDGFRPVNCSRYGKDKLEEIFSGSRGLKSYKRTDPITYLDVTLCEQPSILKDAAKYKEMFRLINELFTKEYIKFEVDEENKILNFIINDKTYSYVETQDLSNTFEFFDSKNSEFFHLSKDIDSILPGFKEKSLHEKTFAMFSMEDHSIDKTIKTFGYDGTHPFVVIDGIRYTYVEEMNNNPKNEFYYFKDDNKSIVRLLKFTLWRTFFRMKFSHIHKCEKSTPNWVSRFLKNSYCKKFLKHFPNLLEELETPLSEEEKEAILYLGIKKEEYISAIKEGEFDLDFGQYDD